MAAHDLSVLRRDQPVDPRCRITRAQFHQNRQRMQDVAQARKFNQQNPRELCGLQRRSVRVLCPRVFDLAIQLVKVHRSRHGEQADRTNGLFHCYAHQRRQDASAGDKRAAQRA